MSGSQVDGSVTVTVNSTFMQDYVAAAPLPGPGYWPWVAPDGSVQVFGYNVAGDTVSDQALTITRAYPDPDSTTGWNTAPPIVLPHTNAHLSTLRGDTPRLVAWSSDSIQIAPLAADGTPGAFTKVGQPLSAIGTIFPVLDVNPCYLLEQSAATQEWFARDLNKFTLIPLKFDPSITCTFAVAVPNGTRDGVLRFVLLRPISHPTSGLLFQWMSAIATLRPDKSAFDVAAIPMLAPGVGGRVAIAEHGPGAIEVVFAQGPFAGKTYSLTTLAGTFDPAGAAPVNWGVSRSATLQSEFDNIGLVAIGDPASDAVELFWLAGDQDGPKGLWSTARATGKTAWPELAIVDDVMVHSMLPLDAPAFLAFRPLASGGQPEIWRRNAQGITTSISSISRATPASRRRFRASASASA